MKTLKVLFILSALILLFESTAYSNIQDDIVEDSQQAEVLPVRGYRFEVLVYSSQIRLMKITDYGEEIKLIVPAVTAEKDVYVPFGKKAPIALIRINPPWTPTAAMHKEEPGQNRPHRGGESGNPLGSIAFYPKFKGRNFTSLRIHQAPEIANRKLEKDDDGNLHGYRESHGCASVSQEDIIAFTKILTGIDQPKIQKIISRGKTRILKPAIPTTMVFLKE